jgi:hypothetical protein
MPTKYPMPPPVAVDLNLPKRTDYRVKRRDQQVRRMVRRWQRLVPVLNDPKFTPLLRGYSMTTLLLEKAYDELKGKELISPKTGELRGSLDTFRNLARAQSHLATQLGLSPTASANLARPVDLVGALAEAEIIDDDKTE